MTSGKKILFLVMLTTLVTLMALTFATSFVPSRTMCSKFQMKHCKVQWLVFHTYLAMVDGAREAEEEGTVGLFNTACLCCVRKDGCDMILSLLNCW